VGVFSIRWSQMSTQRLMWIGSERHGIRKSFDGIPCKAAVGKEGRKWVTA
jgi:hypothetical protein